MDPRKKTLLNLIGAGLIALGSAGLLGGCATSSDTRALASLTRAAAINSDDYERAQRLGKYSELLDAWGFLQQSDERKRQQYQRPQIPEKKQLFFAFNKRVDFDGNGKLRYPDEYIGIKKNFREDERICVVSIDRKSSPGQQWEMAVYNQEGEEIKKRSSEYSVYNAVKGFCFAPHRLQPGSYKAVFKVDGEFIGSTDFNVLPAESSANK